MSDQSIFPYGRTTRIFSVNKMLKTRKQLTLFLDPDESKSIESIRRRFNPKQYRLIKSHITLCREDEIENWKLVQNNLENIDFEAFELGLNKVQRFSEGKGVFIPIRDDGNVFVKLRETVLKNINSNPRDHKAHITLMHPRNSTCSDPIFSEISQVQIPVQINIFRVSLIEQEIGREWKVIEEYTLNKK